MTNTGVRIRLLGGAAMALALAGPATAAAAKVATPAVTKAAPAEEIVVTGSRIPRAGFDTLQPAQTVSARLLEDRGAINAADALNQLSAFGTPGSNNSGQQSRANVGQQFVNLYNLGAQRTLVLVNGRRFVSGSAPTPPGTFGGAPAGQEVDLNTIPVGLIDHIEVLSVGGAPIYGADAIAGTVNVILKDKFQGFQVEGQYGVSRRGDGNSHVIKALAGGTFADGRGNITATVEYSKQDGLTYLDRPKTLPYATFQPSDACKALGFGACYVPNATVPSIFPGGIPAINGGLANAGSPTYPNTGRIFVIIITTLAYFIGLHLEDKAGIFELAIRFAFSGFAALAPVMLAALFWKRSTKWGALAATLWVGFAMLATWWLYDTTATTAPKPGQPFIQIFPALGDLFLRSPSNVLVYGYLPVLPMVLGSAFFMVLGSLFTKPPGRATLEKYFPFRSHESKTLTSAGESAAGSDSTTQDRTSLSSVSMSNN